MEEKKYNASEDIYSKILRAGRRTYFFDVRSTKAGDYYLTISESKKFTNEDIDYHLEHFQRTGLRCFFLMIIGYLTETLQDHHDNLEMYKRWQKYVASGTISGIDLSTSLMFLPNTPLHKMIDTHQVTFPAYEYDSIGNERPNQMIWTSALNPDLTFEERMRRRLEVHEYAMKYKWPIWRGPERLQNLLDHAILYKNGKASKIPVLSVN